MILGFNHNVMYKGEVFHVQTEDSGVAAPHITTLLYKGGVILCSKKTSYADILKIDNLEEVVEELMKEQHKELMRRLKAGEFDERAFAIPASTFENYEIPSPAPEGETAASVAAQLEVAAATGALQENASIDAVALAAASARLLPQKEIQRRTESLDQAVSTFFGV